VTAVYRSNESTMHEELILIHRELYLTCNDKKGKHS
jgi:hypothetical protein